MAVKWNVGRETCLDKKLHKVNDRADGEVVDFICDWLVSKDLRCDVTWGADKEFFYIRGGYVCLRGCREWLCSVRIQSR